MTMKYSSNLLIAFALIISLFSCEKPDVGFFSYEGIEMREDTLEVVRGYLSDLKYTLCRWLNPSDHLRIGASQKFINGGRSA